MPIAATRSSADVRAKPFFQNTGMARRRATSLSNSLGRAIGSTMAFLERIVKNIGHCNEGRAFGEARVKRLLALILRAAWAPTTLWHRLLRRSGCRSDNPRK